MANSTRTAMTTMRLDYCGPTNATQIIVITLECDLNEINTARDWM